MASFPDPRCTVTSGPKLGGGSTASLRDALVLVPRTCGRRAGSILPELSPVRAPKSENEGK